MSFGVFCFFRLVFFVFVVIWCFLCHLVFCFGVIWCFVFVSFGVLFCFCVVWCWEVVFFFFYFYNSILCQAKHLIIFVGRSVARS